MERVLTALTRLIICTLLLAAALGYVMRNSLGTAIFAHSLRVQRGLRCTTPALRISPSLNHVWVGPLRCFVGRGPVKSFETGVAHLRLRCFQVVEAHVDYASVDYHERDISNVRAQAFGQLAAALMLRHKLIKSMLDASEMYTLDPRLVTVDHLIAKRGGRVQLVMHHFKKSMDGSWDRSQAERVDSPGDADVAVRGLDMRVMPGRGRVDAALQFREHGRRPRTDIAFKLEGRQLDGYRPRFSMAL